MGSDFTQAYRASTICDSIACCSSWQPLPHPCTCKYTRHCPRGGVSIVHLKAFVDSRAQGDPEGAKKLTMLVLSVLFVFVYLRITTCTTYTIGSFCGLSLFSLSVSVTRLCSSRTYSILYLLPRLLVMFRDSTSYRITLPISCTCTSHMT